MIRWTVEQAQAWGRRQPWYFGANFSPSTAINQLEMWQKETFDPVTIERELGYAQRIGMARENGERLVLDPTGLAPVVKEVEWRGLAPLNVCFHRHKAGGQHEVTG